MSGIVDSKGFILLSKIAKEKKYAQEYLGLLARRGDLGSIRIGKRWYTTAEWFENFLSDTERRKEEMRAQMMSPGAKKIEEAIAVSLEIKKEPDIKVVKTEIVEKSAEIVQAMPVVPPMIAEEKSVKLSEIVQEPIGVIKAEEQKISGNNKEESPRSSEREEAKINILSPTRVLRPIIPQRREFVAITRPGLKPIRSAMQNNLGRLDMKKMDMRRENFGRKIVPKISKRSQPEVTTYHTKNDRKIFVPQEFPAFELQSRKEIKFEKSFHNFSPSFTDNIKGFSLFFQKLAFSGALVLLFAVLSAGVFLYRKDSANFPKFVGGTVAGAEDTRLASVSSLQGYTSSYFEARRGQTKENVSLSRVILEAALEKTQQK